MRSSDLGQVSKFSLGWCLKFFGWHSKDLVSRKNVLEELDDFMTNHTFFWDTLYKSKYPLYPRSKRASASIRGKKCRNPNIHYIQHPKGLPLQSEANMYKSEYPLYPRSKRASALIRGKKCRNPWYPTYPTKSWIFQYIHGVIFFHFAPRLAIPVP